MSLFNPSGGNLNLQLSGTLEAGTGTFYIQEGATVSNATGTLVFESGSIYNEGASGDIPESGSQLFYDNSVTGLAAENVQEAIDEVKGVTDLKSFMFYEIYPGAQTPPYSADFNVAFATGSIAAFYLVDAGGGDVIATLPEASSAVAGKVLVFKKLGPDNSVIISSSVALSTIDGPNASVSLTADMGSITLLTDGAGWLTI